LFFTVGSDGGIGESLKVHESIYFVFSGEPIKETLFVLIHAFWKIVGKTYVECPTETREEVNEVTAP